jgi:hypothetical protein
MASAVEKLGKTFDRDAFLAGRAHGHWYVSGLGNP